MQVRTDRNLILLTDSYKLTHADQYPKGTTRVHSYFESRVGARFPSTMFLGLQRLILEYLSDEAVIRQDVDEAHIFTNGHFGDNSIFNEKGWRHIIEKRSGRLPIRIWAVPEGSIHPEGTPLMAVENTDDECYWLTNAMETLLSHVWYPSTVATLSMTIKRDLRWHLENTGCTTVPETLQFMLHDFACRGVTSMESAASGGLGHIANFMGTDTVPAIVAAQKFYGPHTMMPAFSVPASEHSTMTTWGEQGELEAYRNMLRRYPNGIVSIVADSWDLIQAAGNLFGTQLRDEIMQRNGRVVIRPDSGDPTMTNLNLIRILAERFGATRNFHGFHVLPPYIRILQGDGMDQAKLNGLLDTASAHGWAAENWVFGMGGGLMQRGLDRDTQRFAFKCSEATINGQNVPVFKRPATDPTKNSKQGPQNAGMDLVFANGTLLRHQSWDNVREHAAKA